MTSGTTEQKTVVLDKANSLFANKNATQAELIRLSCCVVNSTNSLSEYYNQHTSLHERRMRNSK